MASIVQSWIRGHSIPVLDIGAWAGTLINSLRPEVPQFILDRWFRTAGQFVNLGAPEDEAPLASQRRFGCNTRNLQDAKEFPSSSLRVT